MSIYHTVYCPDGNMYEVQRHVFEDVIFNHGWTQTKPISVAVTIPTPVEKRRVKAPAKFEKKAD